MQQSCRFCTQNLNSVQNITRHYNDVHGIKKDNSPNDQMKDKKNCY